MHKKSIQFIFGIGFFSAGVFFGNKLKEKAYNKKTVYAGTLQIHKSDSSPELYLSLNIPPEKLLGAENIILKVNIIK